MGGFDIKSLIDFEPPKYLCLTCKALLPDLSYSKSGKHFCPICKQAYKRSPTNGVSPPKYLREEGHYLDYNDLLGHSRHLAELARDFESPPSWQTKSNIRYLFDMFLSAQHFVHFSTYGMSMLFVGALKMLSGRVPVRGIVSNARDYATEELEDFGEDAPRLKVKLFPNTHPGSYDTMPHQKLIVIDGLVAFVGSANLTVSGWRKAEKGRDHIEVVTDVERVVELHNTLFSPTWAADEKRDLIQCDTIPF